MENGPFIDDFPIKTFIYKWFSMAMLNNQMVYTIITIIVTPRESLISPLSVSSQAWPKAAGQHRHLTYDEARRSKRGSQRSKWCPNINQETLQSKMAVQKFACQNWLNWTMSISKSPTAARPSNQLTKTSPEWCLADLVMKFLPWYCRG